jgi:hypothetical protein
LIPCCARYSINLAGCMPYKIPKGVNFEEA